MKITIASPTGFAILAGVTIALGLAVADPVLPLDALAQTAPAVTTTPEQPPAADGGLAPATPVVPALPPEEGGSMTTSLGGSDVAVASVGGSYEVDAPKRRGHRNRFAPPSHPK